MISRGQETAWASLGRRLKAHWLLKLVGIPGFMAVFFVGYFLVLNFPVFPITQMPMTALDRLIGFHPGALALYLSLWIYISIPPSLMDDTSEIIGYASVAGGLSLVGLALFFFWPTAVPHFDIDWARYGGFGPLKSVDLSGNACPSLHVAFAVFSAFSIGRLLIQMGAPGALRVLNGCWCAGILLSTLATKQHVVLDLAAGAILGGAAGACEGALQARYARKP